MKNIPELPDWLLFSFYCVVCGMAVAGLVHVLTHNFDTGSILLMCFVFLVTLVNAALFFPGRE